MDALTSPSLILNNISTVTVLVLTFILTSLYIKFTLWSHHGSYKLPPGPFSLPIVGTLPFLGTDVREPLRNLSKRYGEIFTVYFGSRRVIVLNSYEAIKEAFVRQGNAFAGRPQDLYFIKEIQAGRGLVSSQGRTWKENRKSTHSILRDFGVGSSYMEDRIRREAKHLQDLITDHLNSPWDLGPSLQVALANVIVSVCYGNREDYSDPLFQQCMGSLNKAFELVGSAGILTAFPMLKDLPGDPFQHKEIQRLNEYTKREMYYAKVNESKDTYRDGIVRNFVDAYLKLMYSEGVKDRDTTLSYEELAIVIADLVAAGTETSTSTLRWGLMYMVRYPEIQRKVQAEIGKVIGKETPSMKHRQSMPYTEACLHEIQRISDVVPLGVPHATLEDVKIMGYDIPKDTMVISNLYSVHFDPNLWPDPHRFNPDRFLDNDGKLQRSEKLIPFSMGKRICIGESLARMELFLFFVIMLQNFNFELPEGASLPGQTGKIGITHRPDPFKLLIKSKGLS